MRSIIEWVDFSNEKPMMNDKWLMVVLKPVNHMDFIDNPSEMNGWISKFGINKAWIHTGSIWINHKDVTDRVMAWSNIPDVPLYDKI